MKFLNKKLTSAALLLTISAMILTITFTHNISKVFAATTRVDLLTADSFAVLAGASIVDSNLSVINGNIGLDPASGSFIGVKCSEITGTIYDNDAGYSGASGGSTLCRTTDPGLLTQAKNDLTTAYNQAANSTPATTLPGGDNQLGGQTLTSGIYTFGHASTANIVGTVTLDGQNDPNAVFIFQASSDFITASSSVVNLINQAQACNVFWQVSTSATFGTSSNFKGTVMADQSITDNGGSTVNGRFLARIASVTLNNTNITKPTCITPTPTPGSSSSSSPSTSSPSVCTSSGVSSVPSIAEARRTSPTSIFIRWNANSSLNDFIIQYGFENGKWLFNTKISGLSTTINDLPANQSIWFEVAATDNCAIGSYSSPVLVGGTLVTRSPGFPNTGIPRLPNTGIGPDNKVVPWNILLLAGIATLVSTSFVVGLRKRTSKSAL